MSFQPPRNPHVPVLEYLYAEREAVVRLLTLRRSVLQTESETALDEYLTRLDVEIGKFRATSHAHSTLL